MRQNSVVTNVIGTVASLHLHTKVGGDPLLSVEEVCAEARMGIVGDARFFGRINREGQVTQRQVSLIAREELGRHAAALGLSGILPGAARANIETNGIDLVFLLGCEMELGEAVLLFHNPRTPCHKMDRVAPGLQALMFQGRQGVMAQVVRSGKIRVGDKIQRRI
jgi:MOSC domain-containing protein YiiM